MALSGQNLCKAWGKHQVVHHVCLQVQRGQVVGLFGPNGAGKTTTFLMMAGLVLPDQGQITLGQTDVTWWPLYRKARAGLRYLPQESSVFSGLSVWGNLKAATEIVRPKIRTPHTVIDQLLAMFQLTEIAHTMAYKLSGGQRRRVEIARALVGDPSFLLLDEPLAGIDPKSVHDVGRLIRQLAEDNRGILLTDHNVKDMLGIVDYAYILSQGSVLFQGTPEQVAQDTNVRRVYLGDHFPAG